MSVVNGKITLPSIEGDEPYNDIEMNQCVVGSERTIIDSQEEARRASVRASMSADIQAIKDRARKARTSLSTSVGAVSVRGRVDSPVQDLRSFPTRGISVPIEVTTFPTVQGKEGSDQLSSFRDSVTSIDVSDIWYADQRSRNVITPLGSAAVQDTSPLSVFSQGHHVRHPSGGSTHSTASLGSSDVQAMQERARQMAALALPGMRAIHDSFDDSSLQSSVQGKHVRHSSCDSSQRMLSLASCDIQAMKERARRTRASITQPGVVMFRDDNKINLAYSSHSPNSGQELPPRPSGGSLLSDASSKDRARADRSSMYSSATLEYSPTVSPYENAHRCRSSSPSLSPVDSSSGEIHAMKERARRSRNSIAYPGAACFRDEQNQILSGTREAEQHETAIAGLNAEANHDGVSHTQWVASTSQPKSEGAEASADSNWVNPFMESERPSSGRMTQGVYSDTEAQGGILRQPNFPMPSTDNRSMQLIRAQAQSMRLVRAQVQSMSRIDTSENKVAVLPYVRNRRLCLVGSMIFCLGIIAVIVGVTVALSRRVADVPSTTTPGAMSSEACVAAGDSDEQSTRFLQFSERFGLSEPNSTRREAICWLADADASQIDPSDQTAAEQRFSLAVFYFSTMPERGGDFALTNWLKEGSECEWLGVTCDYQEIVSLGLSGVGLEGSIPPEVSLLSGLSILLLDGNRLNGTIPDELYQLTTLSILNLEGNFLTGSLSQRVGNLTMLETLSLGQNEYMTGVLPDDLFSLTGLSTLGVSSIL